MNNLFLFLFVCVSLFAQSQESPQQIERELQRDEAQFKRAKRMFNPWYTGPLITPAASMMPLGQANVSAYLSINGTYANFDKHRHSVSLSHNLYFAQIQPGLLVGLTDSVDFAINPSATLNWQNHRTGGGFNDLSATIGFPITRETLYLPNMKFTITETFPTGKYQRLSTNGLNLNSTGGGSYQTQFGFGIGKVIWWIYSHPLHLRFFVGYTIPTTVHVRGFNTYGGGFNTRGTVHPGNTLTTDLGTEWSFTERWVLALDTVYVAQNRTKFHGQNGTLANGSAATVGGGYNENLSFAPAIEYNWNENLGIIWGVQFSVYGRNSQNFIKGQFGVTYTW